MVLKKKWTFGLFWRKVQADCAINDEHGYHEVNPVCVDASFNIANYIAEKKQKRLEAKNA